MGYNRMIVVLPVIIDYYPRVTGLETHHVLMLIAVQSHRGSDIVLPTAF